MTPEEFWTKVERGGPDECWPWTAATRGDGYGVLNERGKTTVAHRRAFALASGPIPAGLCVCHSCDNPPCCNPTHLWLGTIADNNRDMFEKGRRPPAVGVRNARSKLTPEVVREIRRTYTGAPGERKALCAKLGVHKNTLQAIFTRATWKGVEP